MSQITWSQKFPRIGFLQIAIILLAVATAVIHLYLGLGMGMGGGHMAPPTGARPAGTGAMHRGGMGGPGGPGGLMSMLPLPLHTLFILNFVGYIVLVAALYLPFLQRFQAIIRWLLIIFAAVTVILWYILVGSHANTIGYADKAVEVALIVLLLIEAFQTRRPADSAA